jgi:hypothetical protein
MTPTEMDELFEASDDELLTLVGAMSLPLLETPQKLLAMGRGGAFFVTGPDRLGRKPKFKHDGFLSLKDQFFAEWGRELVRAVCKNEALSKELSVHLFNRELATAAVVATLTSHVPELAPYTGLLTALAVLVVRSGSKAFCKLLGSYIEPGKDERPTVKRRQNQRTSKLKGQD